MWSPVVFIFISSFGFFLEASLLCESLHLKEFRQDPARETPRFDTFEKSVLRAQRWQAGPVKTGLESVATGEAMDALREHMPVVYGGAADFLTSAFGGHMIFDVPFWVSRLQEAAGEAPDSREIPESRLGRWRAGESPQRPFERDLLEKGLGALEEFSISSPRLQAWLEFTTHIFEIAYGYEVDLQEIRILKERSSLHGLYSGDPRNWEIVATKIRELQLNAALESGEEAESRYIQRMNLLQTERQRIRRGETTANRLLQFLYERYLVDLRPQLLDEAGKNNGDGNGNGGGNKNGFGDDGSSHLFRPDRPYYRPYDHRIKNLGGERYTSRVALSTQGSLQVFGNLNASLLGPIDGRAEADVHVYLKRILKRPYEITDVQVLPNGQFLAVLVPLRRSWLFWRW